MRKAFPTATILKPAVLVGTEDRMFNSWATLAMNLPYLPLTGGDSQVQVCCRACSKAIATPAPVPVSQLLPMLHHMQGPLGRTIGCCLLQLIRVLVWSCMQPVYVRDVTEALEAVLKDKATIGKTYALAGPRTYTCAIGCIQLLVTSKRLLHADQLL